ncbi:MAG: xanthine dehydrogenase family protein molybdopterin-binding subunit [Alphaproteobacteria bacterium]|nr:xanthine dehydrogenase family protein molybdopterin-binding subunit [Alphaproteobacteria bacterium]
MSAQVTRRGFLIALGLGSAALSLGVRPAFAEGAADFEPNVFVRLESDGALFITCNRSEMGQGVRATLPAVIGLEMGADLSRVEVVQATGDAVYGDQNTDGSTSVRTQIVMLREAGAAAREMLVAAAAARWGVDPAGLVAKDHAVTDPASGQQLGFGELAAEAALQPIPKAPALRPDADVALGEGSPFPDGVAMVTGAAKYGADVTPEGTVTAVILRPPDLGGAVASFDDSEARAVPGVIDVITMRTWEAPGRFAPLGGVAVVASDTWAALEGRRALRVTWTAGPNAEISTEAEMVMMRERVETPGAAKRKKGKADKALASAAQTHSAVYQVPHLSHAQMEPVAALAWVQGDRCEVWAPVQAPQRTRSTVAKVLEINEEDVTVNVTFLGGAFGRKGKPDFVLEAALLSRAVGRPVRVQWTREDDMRHGYYHACAVQRLDAGFDEAGALTAWRHRVCAPSILSTFLSLVDGISKLELSQGLTDLALDVPAFAIETHEAKNRLRIGWLRSVYNINHAFATQSFVDELARLRGVPTPDMLKQVLGPPRKLSPRKDKIARMNYGLSLDDHPIDTGRYYRVIDKVREASSYDAPQPEGRALGFAAHLSFNSYTAVVVAVSRHPDGGPKLEEAWIALDAGTVMNPERVRAQLEGAFIFGASIALYGNITLQDGAVVQGNYNDYPVLRIDEAPRAIHTYLEGSGGPPGGVGEPGVPPVAPAIANAWAALTGERVRTLPMKG